MPITDNARSNTDNFTATTTKFEAPAPVKRKKSNIQQISAAVKDLKQLASDVNKEPPIENEFAIFGNSVGVQLQKLSTYNAVLAQEKIQSILTHFRLDELRSNSAPQAPRIHVLQNYNSTPASTPSPSYSDTTDSQLPSTSYSQTCYHQVTEVSTDKNIGYSDILSQALSDVPFNN